MLQGCLATRYWLDLLILYGNSWRHAVNYMKRCFLISRKNSERRAWIRGCSVIADSCVFDNLRGERRKYRKRWREHLFVLRSIRTWTFPHFLWNYTYLIISGVSLLTLFYCFPKSRCIILSKAEKEFVLEKNSRQWKFYHIKDSNPQKSSGSAFGEMSRIVIRSWSEGWE